MTTRFALFTRRLLAAVALFGLMPAQPVSAAPFEFQIESPSITAIRKSLADRFAVLGSYIESGVVGLTSDGNVALRDAEGLQADMRKLVEGLVADENKDRLTLFREIARANGRPDWEENLRYTFAQRWIHRAPPGWYYRESNGRWIRKPAPAAATTSESSR